MKREWLVFGFLSLIGVCAMTAGADVRYKVIDLGVLGGSKNGEVCSLNNSGQVVGFWWLPDNVAFHSFLWQDEAMHDLGPFGRNYSAAYHINNMGQVALTSHASLGYTDDHALIWEDINGNGQAEVGEWVELPHLAGFNKSMTWAINDNGDAVGSSYNSWKSDNHAVLWKNSGILDLCSGIAYGINNLGEIVGTSPDMTRILLWQPDDYGQYTCGVDVGSGIAYAVNDSHQIVGRSGGYTNNHPFIWNDDGDGQIEAGEWTNLPTLGGSTGEACSNNEHGDVVGTAQTSDGKGHAFIWQRAVGMIDLNSLLNGTYAEWTITSGRSINDNGWIIGDAIAPDGQARPVILVPEPAGPIVYYPFDGDYDDASGNNYNANGYNTSFTTDRCGNADSACLFDSFMDRIELPHEVLDNSNDFTVFARIKLSSSGDQIHTIVSGANPTRDNEVLLLYHRHLNDIGISVLNSTGWANVSLPTNEWISIAWVRHGDTGISEIYLNGNNGPYTISGPSGPVSIPPGGLWLGLDQDSVGGGWQSEDQFYGVMDDVYFYNRALSACEIAELMSICPEPACWIEQDKLLASDGAASDSFGDSVCISGGYAIVGAHGSDANGAAYIFMPNEVNPNNWDQQAKLTASEGAASDFFGYAVSITENYAIVGAQHDGSVSGSAYIFKREGTTWMEQDKLTASDRAENDYFGREVSLSGNYAIVAAPRNDDNGTDSGSAYIFAPNEIDPNQWDEKAKLLSSDGASGDYFGFTVAISGDYAIAGAYFDDYNGKTNAGSAYIFYRNEGGPNNWGQQAKLLASDGAASDYFGYSVSISDECAIVGAIYDDDKGSNSGSAYIFKRVGTNWMEQAKLTASDGDDGDRFGESVCISNDYAIVAAEYDEDASGAYSGSAYIFKREGESYIEQTKLVASDAAPSDCFGMSVYIDAEYAIVGAPGNDDSGENSGSAYVFENICVPAEPDIDVSPLSHDFGDVELDANSTVIVTISNVGDAGLAVSDIAFQVGSSGDFAITSGPNVPAIVEPNETVDVEVTFTPTTLGLLSADLQIVSNDPNEPLVVVQLDGAGIEIPLPPSEQIAEILAFFDDSVEQGTMVGDGPGNSADKRLNALRNMVEAAGDLIEHELFQEACQQLLDAYKKTDGQPRPPDFVQGEAVPQLASMVQELRDSLGCE